jgi:hypothetical protein
MNIMKLLLGNKSAPDNEEDEVWEHLQQKEKKERNEIKRKELKIKIPKKKIQIILPNKRMIHRPVLYNPLTERMCGRRK